MIRYKERKDNNDIIHRPAPFDVPPQIYAGFNIVSMTN
ncbi:hypothetical protein ASZ90_014026 [hydrocarbon metagenome]|uniref:Uncharacterized protein n=1 Tax=hydrocarbon metagenome TaxID=938273 RepID=A0A0W8F627_9ZZZZ